MILLAFNPKDAPQIIASGAAIAASVIPVDQQVAVLACSPSSPR
jgi:hypothetical protein